MASKRIEATIEPTDPDDNVAYQEVGFEVNGEIIGTATIGPEGGKVVSPPFDLQDNRANTVKVIVTPVDAGKLAAEVPAVTVQTFQGADTVPPKTPKPPTFVLVDVAEDTTDTGPTEAEPTGTELAASSAANSTGNGA